MAMGCMKHIRHVFETLEEYRPFEQVHRGRDRSKYLLTKEAKIVAMTCTHAALTRRELVIFIIYKYKCCLKAKNFINFI